jgi:hypothetical protein
MPVVNPIPSGWLCQNIPTYLIPHCLQAISVFKQCSVSPADPIVLTGNKSDFHILKKRVLWKTSNRMASENYSKIFS